MAYFPMFQPILESARRRMGCNPSGNWDITCLIPRWVKMTKQSTVKKFFHAPVYQHTGWVCWGGSYLHTYHNLFKLWELVHRYSAWTAARVCTGSLYMKSYFSSQLQSSTRTVPNTQPTIHSPNHSLPAQNSTPQLWCHHRRPWLPGLTHSSPTNIKSTCF